MAYPVCKKFPLMHQNLCEIDVNYCNGTASWKTLAAGLTSTNPSLSETVDTTPYLDGGGFSESEVTGAQMMVTCTGHRVVGDAAQDYIFSKDLSLGEGRYSQVRYTDSEGNVVAQKVTIANIALPNGDAGAKGAISFELHFAGKPVKTPASTAPALVATIVAGTASGTTKFTATPAEGNSLGYLLTASDVGDPNANSSVQFIAYTSGANIQATAGQYLNMFELDANNRVVKFLSQVLASGDIAA